jgi:hypothetical protein
VPDRFQISEIYAAKKYRTKRNSCVVSFWVLYAAGGIYRYDSKFVVPETVE